LPIASAKGQPFLLGQPEVDMFCSHQLAQAPHGTMRYDTPAAYVLALCEGLSWSLSPQHVVFCSDAQSLCAINPDASFVFINTVWLI